MASLTSLSTTRQRLFSMFAKRLSSVHISSLQFRQHGIVCGIHRMTPDVTLMILSMFTVAKAILEVLTVLQHNIR